MYLEGAVWREGWRERERDEQVLYLEGAARLARAFEVVVHDVCLPAGQMIHMLWRMVNRLENNCVAVMRCSSKEGLYLRLVDFCMTQL